MPKKKRKTGALSAMMKSAAIACGIYEPVNAADVREKLNEMKIKGKEALRAHGMSDGPASSFSRDPEVLSSIMEICGNDFDNYILHIRKMVMGYWLNHRVIYHISDETIDFINSQSGLFSRRLPIGFICQKVCEKPIFLEFTGSKYNIPNAFCSLTSLAYNEYCKSPTAEGNLSFVLFVADNPPLVMVRGKLHSTLSEDFYPDDDESGRTENIILRALAYIAFLIDMVDSGEETLVERQMPAAKCYDVFPSPYLDSIPDFSTPLGVLRGGLCFFFSYLSRARMLSSFHLNLAEIADKGGPESVEERVKTFVMSAVMDWEESRTIYAYDSKSAEVFRDRYVKPLLLEGLSAELLSFIPHRTIILFNSDTANIVLITPVDNGKLSIFSIDDEMMVSLVEAGNPLLGHHWVLKSHGSSIVDTYIEALCVLWHMLLVFKAKAEKVWAQHSREVGHLRVSNANAEPPEPPLMRMGEDILPPTLYSVTTKTVRRIPQKELIHKHGWKMIPHVRRGHPHRYWVGRGEERHMEVRWLKEVKVNASEKQPISSTVIHRVRG